MSSPTTASAKRPRKVNEVAELKKNEATNLNIMFGELLQLSKAVYESPSKEAKVVHSGDTDHTNDVHVKPADLKALLKALKKKTYEIAKPSARVKQGNPRIDIPIHINGAIATFLNSVLADDTALGVNTPDIRALLEQSVVDGVTTRKVFAAVLRLYIAQHGLNDVVAGKVKGNLFHFDEFLSQVFGSSENSGGIDVGYLLVNPNGDNKNKSKYRNTTENISTVQYMNTSTGNAISTTGNLSNFTGIKLLSLNSVSLKDIEQAENFLQPEAVIDRFGTTSADLSQKIAVHKLALHEAADQIGAYYSEMKPSAVKKSKK